MGVANTPPLGLQVASGRELALLCPHELAELAALGAKSHTSSQVLPEALSPPEITT